MESSFIICAMKYGGESDYAFAYDEHEMREICKEFMNDGWEIEFAGKIQVIKEYTNEMK